MRGSVPPYPPWLGTEGATGAGAGAGGPSPEMRERLRAARRDVLFGHRYGPDAIRLIIAAWKSLLFLPAAGLVFHWCRRLYGLHAGWLALVLVLVDPTFAAHIPMATTDVPALEGVLFACYFAWRAMEEPRRYGLLVAAAVFTLDLLHPLIDPRVRSAEAAEARA